MLHAAPSRIERSPPCTSAAARSSRTSATPVPTRDVYAHELGDGRPRRAARLRLGVGRRAPLHRLHDVPRPVAAPHLGRRPHEARAARQHGDGAAVARSGAHRRELHGARPHVAGPRRSSASAAASRASSSRASARRWASRAGASSSTPRRSSRALETGFIEYDGELYQQPRAAIRPGAVPLVEGTRLRLVGVARVVAHHGEARRRHHDHRAEAVGQDARRPRRVPRHLPRGERRGAAEAAARELHRRARGRGDGARDVRAPRRRLLRVDDGALRVRQRAASPTSPATSTTPASPATSRSTARTSSAASSPISRCGARPTRSSSR